MHSYNDTISWLEKLLTYAENAAIAEIHHNIGNVYVGSKREKCLLDINITQI